MHWEMLVESLQLMKAPDLIIFWVFLFSNAQINSKFQHPRHLNFYRLARLNPCPLGRNCVEMPYP